MPLLKPKKNVYAMEIRCCICSKKEFKPTFRYSALQQKMFYCKNCGLQLTFKQMDEFTGSNEFQKQKSLLNK